jgi:hypothetical protein
MGKRRSASKPVRPEAPNTGSAASLAAHAYWLFPFALFLILRLFSGDPYYLLGGDQCTFLELARTFPKHQLFNHELYLIHSPLFGYAIGILHLALPLLASGLLAVLIFACLNFFAVRALGQFENLPRTAVSIGLIYLAISRPAVAYDYHVARISILVCSNALALLAFVRMLEKPGRKMLLLAIAANVFTLLVSDQGLVVLPCEALLFLARRPRHWKPVLWLAADSAAAALIWPAVRLIEFSTRADLPAGISGTIEFTRNFPWAALLQPNFLPFTNAHRSLFTQTSLSLRNLKPGLLAGLPTDLLLLPRWLSALLTIVLICAAMAESGRRKRALVWLGMSLLFLLPVGMGMNEWYGLGFLVPFALLMMEGAAVFTVRADKAIAIGLSAACILAAVLWMAAPAPEPHDLLSPRGGMHFLFTRPPVTRGAVVATYFASMPRDIGIMAPTDLSPEVVYLTDKRVVALPFDPAVLDKFIDEYNISYILTSSEFFVRYPSPVADKYTSSLVMRYLAEHQDRYRLVNSQRENYLAFYPPLQYYVLQVQKR